MTNYYRSVSNQPKTMCEKNNHQIVNRIPNFQIGLRTLNALPVTIERLMIPSNSVSPFFWFRYACGWHFTSRSKIFVICWKEILLMKMGRQRRTDFVGLSIFHTIRKCFNKWKYSVFRTNKMYTYSENVWNRAKNGKLNSTRTCL